MVLLNKCCCCGLRTGAMILGWLGLVSCILNLVSMLSSVGSIEDRIPQDKNIDPEIIRSVVTSVYYSIIGSAIVGIIMNALLIYGTHKNKRLLLLPWLITIGIELVSVTVIIIIIGIVCFVAELSTIGIVVFLIGLPYAALQTYFWICVLSLYQRFNEEERSTRRHQENVNFLTHTPNAPSYDPALPPYKSVV